MCILLFKTDSSLGRLFIYKITWNIWTDHWRNGLGLGKFHINYLYYQAEYFKASRFTQKELLLADNTQHAFNDYWQFLLETGIKGIVFLLFLIVFILILAREALKNTLFKPHLLALAIVQIIAIAVAALFTHIFEYYIAHCVFLVALFIISSYINRPVIRIVKIGLLFLFIFLSYSRWAFPIKNYGDYQKMDEAQALLSPGYITDAYNKFTQLYASLKDDPDYLTKYGTVLSTYENYTDAEKIFQFVLTKRCSSMDYYNLANCYMAEGKMQQAEGCFIMAINMVPNRFVARYNLYQFYLHTNQMAGAEQVRKDILSLPVKINSPTIVMIKQLIK